MESKFERPLLDLLLCMKTLNYASESLNYAPKDVSSLFPLAVIVPPLNQFQIVPYLEEAA